MLTTLIKRFTSKRALVKPETQVHASESLWQDTGQVFYLESTLKLVYQSNSGKVTLERIRIDELANTLAQIRDIPATSPLAQRATANQDDAFQISVCAVTWQEKGDSLRIKALPDAAVLRSTTACFERSQAVFKHSFLLEHDDLLTQSLGASQDGVFTYNRISIEQFSEQISQVNASLTARYKRALSINPDNFDDHFTEHETSQIAQLIDLPSQTAIDKPNSGK